MPDARVEKSMISDLRRGDKPAIALLSPNEFGLIKENQVNQYKFTFGALAQFGFRNSDTLTQVKSYIEEFDPDIIHAHDIYNAILAYKLDFPFIYNDHEAWSFKIAATVPISSKMSFSYWRRYFGLFIRKRLIPKWENKILKNRVSLAVSEKLAEFHRSKGATSFVVNNYPLLDEVQNNEIVDKIDQSIVYIGTDLSYFSGPFRDTRGFLENVTGKGNHLTVIGDSNIQSSKEITNHGYVKHAEINSLLGPIKFGALAFRPHPFHAYADHIKIYNYVHAGMILIAPHSFEIPEILEIRKYEKFSEIPDLLKKPSRHTPEEIISHAREKFIWERREKSIEEATKLTLETN